MLTGDRLPWGYVVPKSADDLVGMGRCFAATTFLSAGNITHTPAYGHLIALGILGEVQQRNASAQQIEQCRGLSPAHRPHRPLPDVLRRRRDHRLSHAPRSGRTRRAAHRARDRLGRGAARQDRHAHQPRLRRGRVYRRALRRRLRQAPRDLRRAGECAWRHGHLPQDRDARRQSVRLAAQQPLRRAGRADVARRRACAVGTRVPGGSVAGADRALAVLASAVLLAVEGGVHAGPGAGLHACDGPDVA